MAKKKNVMDTIKEAVKEVVEAKETTKEEVKETKPVEVEPVSVEEDCGGFE